MSALDKLVQSLIDTAVDPLGQGNHSVSGFSHEELEQLEKDGYIYLRKPAYMVRDNNFSISDSVREMVVQRWSADTEYPLGIMGAEGHEWITKLDAAVKRPDGKHVWEEIV